MTLFPEKAGNQSQAEWTGTQGRGGEWCSFLQRNIEQSRLVQKFINRASLGQANQKGCGPGESTAILGLTYNSPDPELKAAPAAHQQLGSKVLPGSTFRYQETVHLNLLDTFVPNTVLGILCMFPLILRNFQTMEEPKINSTHLQSQLKSHFLRVDCPESII